MEKTPLEKLRHAKKQQSFWKSEVKRLTIEIAGKSPGVFPRLAHVREEGLYANCFGVVLGIFDQYTWPCIIVNRRTRKTTNMNAGWPLRGMDGNTITEPKWMTPDEEREIVAEFKNSAWAKKIKARLVEQNKTET